MGAVAAGLGSGAALRRWLAKFGDSAHAGARAARLMSLAALALAAAMLVCTAFGYGIAQRNDGRMQAARHAALQLAVDEFAAVFGDISTFEGAQLRQLERRAGLQDLRFETEPATDAAREMQSLHDRNGRILGWYSWLPDRALIRAMTGLWGVAAAVAAALAVFALLAALYARRLAAALASSERSVHKLTSEDALTGLPNQRVMIENLAHALARRGSGYVAFAVVDLDGFREVNDTLGRDGGDSMFARIVERLKAGLPVGAQCGRYEDNSFAVVMTGAGPEVAARISNAIRAVFARSIFMSQPWQIDASLGLAQAPGDGTSAEELTRRAGLALRAAKRQGRGLALHFEPAIESEHYDRRFLLRELKAAVATQAFDVHYQPVVSADGSGILGVEALLRWTHAQRGAIAPALFIPLAEQSGLMPELGAFVLRRALADAARWPDLFVAVNLSPMQMRDRTLVDLVATVMTEMAIAPARVVLEVTEGVLIDDPHEAKSRLEALRGLGVRIALDDFGAGYSSLSYLQQLPFDRLKIDRGFVAELGQSGNAAAIIQSVVTLGHALGMSVLAEGVETDEQRVLLRLAGCDEMQGYLFARPAPAKAIDTMLASSFAPVRRVSSAGR